MCGIVGYIGNKSAVEVLVEGLRKLEYRGYDSSGVALNSDGEIKVYKAKGKLQNLEDVLKPHSDELKSASLGIGHIRWATHGAPTEANAHPHTCSCGKLVIVHNGIIENFKELKEDLIKQGCTFRSQTDTETVAHLIASEYNKVKDLTEAVRLATQKIIGAYALCIMHKDMPNILVATKRNAPLLIGIGENEYFVASDVPAIIEHTKKALYLQDDEIVTLSRNGMVLINEENKELNQKIEVLPWEPVALSKMGFKHFMLKEIHEQPDVIRNVLSGKL